MITALLAIPLLLAHGATDSLRGAVCINGQWDVVLHGDEAAMPKDGWTAQRTPAMPLRGATPIVSAWYRSRLLIPADWVRTGRGLHLEIEKAGHFVALYVNGKRMGEHFGQYTPFEAEITSAVAAGKQNEIAIYVHNASGKYARPGADIKDGREGNAYRGATDSEPVRNWVGIVGDITLNWRPAKSVSTVFVVPSVRKHTISATMETSRADGLTIRSAVLDGESVVLKLPDAKAGGRVQIEAPWKDPILWGSAPYGTPKLYYLRTELIQQGKVIDRKLTRFGFREVWIEGRDVMLNGKKLLMSGTYFPKLAAIRYINDRRAQASMLSLMQASGLNTLHGHWDDLGRTWMDLCDEMGVLVLAGFYCDGRPLIHSRADAGWADWMETTCRDWVRTLRHHPSVVLWRPSDVLPPNVVNGKEAFAARLAKIVRAEDGTRPMADGSDIFTWAQNHLKDPQNPNVFDDGSRVAEQLAKTDRPLLTKEIYTGFPDFEEMSPFFRGFYEKSQAGGSTGTIIQHLPLRRNIPHQMRWLSDSGDGNRDLSPAISNQLTNWSDPAQPAWAASHYSVLFAELAEKYMNRKAAGFSGAVAPEVLFTGLKPDEFAMIECPSGAIGVRAAADGSAWITAPLPGNCKNVKPESMPRKPGYDYVQRMSVIH